MSSMEADRVRRYVDGFNRHDIEAVMSCFAENAAIIDMDGRRHDGQAQIRQFYEKQFRAFPDGRCDISRIIGEGGVGMAETEFKGTHTRSGTVIEAVGPEIVQLVGDKIVELRDYHRLTERTV